MREGVCHVAKIKSDSYLAARLAGLDHGEERIMVAVGREVRRYVCRDMMRRLLPGCVARRAGVQPLCRQGSRWRGRPNPLQQDRRQRRNGRTDVRQKQASRTAIQPGRANGLADNPAALFAWRLFQG